MTGVHAAIMGMGGWFDAEDLSGPFKTFRAIDEFNPGAVNSIVVGPWSHGGWTRGWRPAGGCDFRSEDGSFLPRADPVSFL